MYFWFCLKRQRALTILPCDKEELTMIDVFSILPELDTMIKEELPERRIELDPFAEFIYRQFSNDEISKMFHKIDRDQDQILYPKDIVYFLVKKFKLKTVDNMKHKLKKVVQIALNEINIPDGQLTEQAFIRFWYYWTSLIYNIAPKRTNTIKQSDIVFFFESRGHGLAQDVIKSVLKLRQLGNEVNIVQYYTIYPLLIDGMKGRRHRTTGNCNKSLWTSLGISVTSWCWV